MLRGSGHPGWAMAAVALASLWVLGGCSHSRASTSATTGSTAKSPSSTSSSAVVNPRAAVLAAYRAEWAAFEQASETSDAADPALAATMVDPLLSQVRANLDGDKANGVVARGTFTLHPVVATVSATSATVVDCAYSTSELVYADTGRPVQPVTPPENDGVRATLVHQGSVWKVAQQVVRDGSCASVS